MINLNTITNLNNKYSILELIITRLPFEYVGKYVLTKSAFRRLIDIFNRIMLKKGVFHRNVVSFIGFIDFYFSYLKCSKISF